MPRLRPRANRCVHPQGHRRDVLWQALDVTDSAAIARFAAAVEERFDRIDICVTNSGGPPSKLFVDISPEEWRTAVDLLLMSAFCSAREVLPRMKRTLNLSLLPGRYSICRLAPHAALPSWALKSNFCSLTRTREELSLVCEEAYVPADVQAEGARRLFRVQGPLAFSQTGVLASLAAPLAEAGISIFAVSTFDTDYLLVSERDTQSAIAALEQAGHTIDREESA